MLHLVQNIFSLQGHPSSKEIKEQLTNLQKDKDDLFKLWEDNLQNINQQKAYILMVGEVKEIDEWLKKQESLGQSPDHLPKSIKQLSKLEKSLSEYAKRISYLKDSTAKLPQVRDNFGLKCSL